MAAGLAWWRCGVRATVGQIWPGMAGSVRGKHTAATAAAAAGGGRPHLDVGDDHHASDDEPEGASVANHPEVLAHFKQARFVNHIGLELTAIKTGQAWTRLAVRPEVGGACRSAPAGNVLWLKRPAACRTGSPCRVVHASGGLRARRHSLHDGRPYRRHGGVDAHRPAPERAHRGIQGTRI